MYLIVNNASLTITGGGTTTVDAQAKYFANFYSSSNATATTIAYSNILNGAIVTIDYLKTTASDIAITFPSGTIISQSSDASINGLIATLNSTSSGRYTIIISNINDVYKVYITKDIA